MSLFSRSQATGTHPICDPIQLSDQRLPCELDCRPPETQTNQRPRLFTTLGPLASRDAFFAASRPSAIKSAGWDADLLGKMKLGEGRQIAVNRWESGRRTNAELVRSRTQAALLQED